MSTSWRALNNFSNEIINRLNDLARQAPIDETKLAGIEFQAQRLRSSSLAHNVILGMIATLRGDADGVVRALDSSRNSVGDDIAYFYSNFAISLAEVGANDVLQKFVAEGLQRVGGDPDYLRTTISVLCGVGRPFQAAELRLQLAKLFPIKRHTADIIMVAEELTRREITEADTIGYTDFVRGMLHAKGVRRFGQLWSFAAPRSNDEPVAIVELGVPFDAIECVDAEDELFDLLLADGRFEKVRQSIVFKLDPDAEGEDGDGECAGLSAAG